MKKKITALAGVSGSGKTFLRQNDPVLQGLECVDIRDIYWQWPEVDWSLAHESLIRQAFLLLLEHNHVVIEAYFLKGTPSRKMLEDAAKVQSIELKLIECWAPLETCVERLTTAYRNGHVTYADAEHRIKLARKCWRPRKE